MFVPQYGIQLCYKADKIKSKGGRDAAAMKKLEQDENPEIIQSAKS